MENVTFPFPFEPYDVQQAFMKNLYSTLENSKIGIFESPTGTGKSLSIICGSLKWLKDHQLKQKQHLQRLISETIDNKEDDWFNSFLEKQQKVHKVQDAKEEYKSLIENEERINKLRNSKKVNAKVYSKTTTDLPNSKRKKLLVCDENENLSDEEFAIIDYEQLVETEESKEEKKHVLKIFYASRTHSQLAQFLGEIHRSPYQDQVTVTTLGSRANFCINESVTLLKNLSLINERCTDLQRNKSSSKKSCPYLKNFSDMQDSVLSSVRDIEEIVQLGKILHSCPYYATRRVIPDVEIVLLPYNILLHKPTRDAYGIVLKNNVVIVDEAHNLVEAVNNMYSAEITQLVLEQTFLQVDSYLNSYRNRLSRENLRFIKLFIQISSALSDYLKDTKRSNESKMIPISDFISQSGIANINIFELVKFAEHSLLGQKIHGYTLSRIAKGITPTDDLTKNVTSNKLSGTVNFLSKIKESKTNKVKMHSSNENKEPEKTVQYRPSAIFSFIEFLKTLTFPTADGRILVQTTSSIEQSSLKFLHLNPVSHFKEIVQECRSVVLAGGTMQPISEFTEQLFIPCGVPNSRIELFSCGHVIPPDNLLALGLAKGPCGNILDFTYKSRRLPETVKELGSILLNVTNAIRGGVVCFFPSYDYEEFIFGELTKTKMLQSITKKYKVFREPKLSSDVDRVLSDYAKSVSAACSGNSSLSGAILLSIVGGKMSEGINFSDDLGRCVIMVGLPYPNKFSVELQEKMTYLNQHNASSNGKKAGDIYYNNLCMKAVNQSIGRAIRHKNDYASILLLDSRYSNSSVRELLPEWISKSLSFHPSFGTAYMALRKFFSNKRNI